MPMQTALTVTPTLNSIAIRHGDFLTTTDALSYAAEGEAGFNFFNVFGQLTAVLSYKQLKQRSMQVALYLKRQGYSRHDRFVFIAETSPEFLILFFACQYAGLIPCPVAFNINLGGLVAYTDKLNLLLQSSDARAVIASQEAANAIGQYLDKPLLVSEVMIEQASRLHQPSLAELSPFGPDEPAYIQFSSGSTTQPKGMQIGQQHLHANIYAVLRYGMQLRHEDRSFNWLPFHHNMGLVGFMLASVYGQRSVDCLSAENFVQNPLIWLELMSRYKTAITFAPIFGYQLAMKKFMESQDKPDLDLSSLRIAGIGGDMISPGMLNAFSACFSASGFKYQAFLPSYGLTETTLAISTADTSSEPTIDVLPDDPTHKQIVSCGKALPGFEIKIIDSVSQQRLAERQIGQIWVKGPSIISGYIDGQNQIVFDSEGFMYTGDLGYLYHQQLFISGREKDVIIIRGRNIWAQDIEWSVLQTMPELGVNNVAAIGISEPTVTEPTITVQQQEKLLILIAISAELAYDRQKMTKQVKQIQKTTAQVAGVEAQVVLIGGRLPLTSSGKLARAKAREAYLANQLNVINCSGERI